MKLHNTTRLDSGRLEAHFRRHAAPWPLDGLEVYVRPSRSAPFSGLCNYRTGRIYVNLGRRVRYPYALRTCVARARSTLRGWSRPVYVVEIADAYQLALFVFLHELYHWLVRKARRNTRQKESRCDRFAVRALVDAFGAVVRDEAGRAVPREDWDFQDLFRFVAAALSPAARVPATAAARRPRRKATCAPRVARRPRRHCR